MNSPPLSPISCDAFLMRVMFTRQEKAHHLSAIVVTDGFILRTIIFWHMNQLSCITTWYGYEVRSALVNGMIMIL